MSVQSQTPMSELRNFPRIECGIYPTPLEEMVRLRAVLGPACPRLFIKRDDLTGTGFGSNKLRKLDYAIAREIERGTTTIVTIAGEKSNHARVTAAVCAKFGLKCVLVLNRSDSSEVPPGFQFATRFIYELLGAEIIWVDSREEREPTAIGVLDALQARGERAAYIPLGVSVPLGGLGFVRAIEEVYSQFAELAVEPDHIFHAGTSGGTQAGIIAGCRILEKDPTITAVSPDDPADEIAERVASITNGIFELIGSSSKTILKSEVNVLDGYIGAGYGIETDESRDSLRLVARTEAIVLDPVYTAKTMAALFDWIKNGRLTADQNVLFWHTGGQLAMFYARSNV